MLRSIKGAKTMHEHDIERIAAVAEGRLTGEELAAARTEIDSCDECRLLLQQQITALRFLHDAPQPALTAAERSTLHRALRHSPTRSRWLRLAPAFAAAAAIVVAVGIGSLPHFTGGQETSAKLGLEQTGGALDNSTERYTGLAPEATLTTAAPTSTMAASGTTLAAASDAVLSFADLPELANRLRAEPPEEGASTCRSQAIAKSGLEMPTASLDIDIDQARAVMYVYPDVALVFDAEACTLLETIPADAP
jgi:hypothetical protein